MTDVLSYDICKEHDALTPATIVFGIQRTDDPDAPPPFVRCCDLHEGPAAIAAALMRSRLTPAAVFRVALNGDAEQASSLSLASVTASSKEPSMAQRSAVWVITFFLLASLPGSGVAWNKAGHMVSGAIAWSDLTQANATALARVVELLKAHPDFPTKWTTEITKPFVPPEERDLYLFMLAARWPDDIRGTQRYDRPPWHYINHPFLPAGGPTVPPVDPTAEHIRSAYAMNRAILQSGAPSSERAIALCWIFHLIGDVHQPLHTVKLVTTQFPAPQGDRGGTRFFI